jgi:hypothetical protein
MSQYSLLHLLGRSAIGRARVIGAVLTAQVFFAIRAESGIEHDFVRTNDLCTVKALGY